MVKAGLGVAALLILILSTVTTTFLDAYSAGISAESLSKKINGKYAALIVTVIGTSAPSASRWTTSRTSSTSSVRCSRR